MKPKKNPNADLKRRTGLFFAIGLAVATFASLYAINYNTSERDEAGVGKAKINEISEIDVEEINMDEPEAPPPAPEQEEPPKEVETPEVIVEKDDKEKIDLNLNQTEDNKEDKTNVPAPKINTNGVPGGKGTGDDDIPDDGLYSYYAIEQKPMFPQCKDAPKAQQEECFKKSLDAFVYKTLVYPQAAIDMNSQGRVIVQFRIKKDGFVEVINTQGKDKILEKEARRVIEKLPQLIPGKQRERPVAVIFSYPIVFSLK